MSELIDNRAERIRILKQLVRQCDAGEIAAMEQELMADGVPVEEIMGVDQHYQRKENLLFPILERHGIVGP